jgi:hypothetical protein
MNVAPETKIFSTGDNQLYYVSFLNISAITEDTELRHALESKLESPQKLITELKKRGFKYALDTDHWNQGYWSQHAWLLRDAAEKKPKAIVYKGTNSMVIDLDLL